MVRVYYASSEKFEHRFEELLPLLLKARREKTNRYLKKEDKILSLMSGLLLYKVLDIKDDAQISYNEHCKPYLEQGPCFSLSHSGKYAVLAVAESQIGIDIETAKGISKAVMRRCFTEEEQVFAALSTENALRLWTAKEAVLKLLGTGFSLSPKSFSVLPLDAEREIKGVTMRFFCEKLSGDPLTVAASGETEIQISEILPENFI